MGMYFKNIYTFKMNTQNTLFKMEKKRTYVAKMVQMGTYDGKFFNLVSIKWSIT